MGASGVKVEIWSDIACPWCHIGKRRFEAALARFPHPVEVVWKSFELDPHAVGGKDGDYATRLAAKYSRTVPQAQQMLNDMTTTAAIEGLAFRFDLAQAGSTFDAHRVIHAAGQVGLQDAMKERLLRAYFEQGEAVHDHDTLVRLAAEVGLDVHVVLQDDTYADAVRREEAEALELGITGVPFFVVDRRYGISGAQPVEVLLGALERAWAEQAPLALVEATSGACGGDTCAV